MNNDVRISTIVKKVSAGMREYFDFGGQAFAGYFPVDVGTAYLYKIEGEEFIPIDTTQFDEYGYYGYYALIEGEYRVKTFPASGSANAGQYLPTYYGDVLLWTKAESIILNETNHNYDIYMIPNFSYNSGDGAIDGVVTLENGDNPSLDNVEVILFNEEDNCLTYINSDKEGGFEFIELPYGTYKVLAEVPGKYTYPSTIVLSPEHPSIDDLNIIVYDEEMSFGISDPGDHVAGLGEIYPNPARTFVNLEISLDEQAQVQYFILNHMGQVLEKQTGQYNKGDHVVQLNTADLAPGMYRLMVLTANEKHIKSFIKVD
jgi:hypothetical protein